MSYSYVVTAIKATATIDSLTGNFTSPSDLNLVIAKSSRLEIHVVTPEGLVWMYDVPVYGNIVYIDFFRPPEKNQDYLFVLTDRFQPIMLKSQRLLHCPVVRLLTERGEFRRSMNLISIPDGSRDTHACLLDLYHPRNFMKLMISCRGRVAVFDRERRVVGLYLYEGLFRIISIDQQGRFEEAVSMRIDEPDIRDICFLEGGRMPVLATLCVGPSERVYIRMFNIDLADRALVPSPGNSPVVNGDATRIISVPKPTKGLIVFSDDEISYHPSNSSQGSQTVPIAAGRITAVGRVDENGTRYLIGHDTGALYVLVLEKNESRNAVTSLQIEYLGEVSVPSSISYLDNGVVYIGSRFGDSQLIRLSKAKNDDGKFLEILESYTNLGPIVDISLVDIDKQGQCQAVTCSGLGQNGTLRIVRSGIGITEQAAVELPGIKNMWALRTSSSAKKDTYLVQSFVGETRILAIEGEEMEETTIPGFSTLSTKYCGNLKDDKWLQVTEEELRVIDCNTMQCIQVWTPPEGLSITLASATSSQCVVSCGSGNLVYLELNNENLVFEEKAHVVLQHEIACVDMYPLQILENHGELNEGCTGNEMPLENGVKEADTSRADLVSVGLWTDMSVRILTLPLLKECFKHVLSGTTQARSLMLHTFEKTPYMLVGLGDGRLISFHVRPGTTAPMELHSQKEIALGTQPLSMTRFTNEGRTCIFVTGDRPTVVYHQSDKLLYANVNTSETMCMCSFDCEMFPGCLALASDDTLMIGNIDQIQKLHIQAIPINETPRRIAHHVEGRLFVVLTVKRIILEPGEGEEEAYVRFYDDSSFNEIHSYKLGATEKGSSVCTASIIKGESHKIVVGTAFVNPEEQQPKEGRLIVFSIIGKGQERKVDIVSSTITKGAVYSLCPLGNKVLAAVNDEVELYGYVEGENQQMTLEKECEHEGHVMALYLRSRGDFIVVGDLMRSVCLLQYKEETGIIEEIARDFRPQWMTQLEMIDDEIYLGAENECSLFKLKKNSDAACEDDRQRLEQIGAFHLGDFVNKLCIGSLGSQPTDIRSGKTTAAGPTIVFGTVNGMIGVIISISEEEYRFFHALQNALTKLINGIGGFQHEQWRTSMDARSQTTTPPSNFIDGDLVESFLELTTHQMEEVTKLLREDLAKSSCYRRALRMESKESNLGKENEVEFSVRDVTRRLEEMARLH